MNINSFLFRYNPSDISNEKLTKNLHLVTIKGEELDLESEKVDDTKILPDNEIYKFGYLLRLLKPRKVLWLGENIPVNNETETILSLEKDGIVRFDSIDEYTKNTEGNNEIAAFDFVVFYKSFDSEYYLKNQIHLPTRVLVVDDGKERFDKPNIKYVDSFNKITNSEELIEKCWMQWLNRLEKPATAYIYYEQNEEAGEKLDNTELTGAHSIKCAGNLTKETIIDNESISVIYDHHGWAIDKTKLELKEDEDFEPITNFYTRHSKIFFDKGSDDFVSLNYPPDEPFKRKILAYQLIDAATTNIFILDERIATTANEEAANTRHDKLLGITSDYDSFNFSRLCYGKVFAINNIRIEGGKDKPIHSDVQRYYLSMQINSDSISLNSEDKVKEVLGDIDEINKDILVLHRTYLKKETLGMEVQDFLKLANKQFGSVIITSGGGYPHNLPEPVRFVPFSIIERSISSRLSKLKLTSYLQKLKYVV